jgi:magnesium transporter
MNPPDQIAEAFLLAHPELAAETLEDQPPGACAALLSGVSAEPAVQVLACMLPLPASRCLAAMDRVMAARLLERLPRRQAVDLLRRLPVEVRDPMLSALPRGTAHLLRRALSVANETVSTLTDPAVLALPSDALVERAVRLLSTHQERADCHLYVVQDNARLLGSVALRELFAAAPSQRLGRIADRRVPHLPAAAAASSVLNHPGWKRFAALPVTDAGGRFIGVLRRERLRDLEKAPARRGGGGLELTLSLLEAYTATSHALLSALAGTTRDRDAP